MSTKHREVRMMLTTIIQLITLVSSLSTSYPMVLTKPNGAAEILFSKGKGDISTSTLCGGHKVELCGSSFLGNGLQTSEEHRGEVIPSIIDAGDQDEHTTLTRGGSQSFLYRRKVFVERSGSSTITRQEMNQMSPSVAVNQRSSDYVQLTPRIKRSQYDSAKLDQEFKSANVLHGQGKHEEALKAYREVFEKMKNTLGPNHPSTLNAEFHIANVLHGQGKHEEALRAYREVFEKMKNSLGPNHPSTLNAEFHIANVLHGQGKHEEALRAYREVFEKMKNSLGPNHPSTLNAEFHIPSVLHAQGKHSEVWQRYQELFEKHKALISDRSKELPNCSKVCDQEKSVPSNSECRPSQDPTHIPNKTPSKTTDLNNNIGIVRNGNVQRGTAWQTCGDIISGYNYCNSVSVNNKV